MVAWKCRYCFRKGRSLSPARVSAAWKAMSASVISGMSEGKKTPSKTTEAMARYTHCTFSSTRSLSKVKKTYEPRTGATAAPIPVKDCETFMRISKYLGGPQTAMYGFAAVSRDPRPLPMTKMPAQNPQKLLLLMAGMASRDPRPGST